MKATRLVLAVMEMLFLTSLAMDEVQASTNHGQPIDTLHFYDVLEPLTHYVFSLEQFYRDAERRMDFDKAISDLVMALDEKGYQLEQVKGKGTCHFRYDQPVGDCREQHHLLSEDGTLTLDVIVFSHEDAIHDFSSRRPRGPSFGSSDPFRLAQLLVNKPDEPDKKGELVARVRAGTILLNLNKILPFTATWGLKDAEAEHQATLHELESEIGSFCHIASLAIKHLVVAEDRPSMPQMGAPLFTASSRIANFVNLWSEVKYNFANFDLVPRLNWDRMKDRYLPLIEKANTDEEYFRALQKLLAELHDGHTSLLWDSGSWPPLQVGHVGGKAIITDILESVEMGAAGLLRGMEITHVDGRPAKDIIEQERYPYISASTTQSRDLFSYMRLLQGQSNSTVTITVRDISGSVRKATLTRSGRWIRDKQPFEYRLLPRGIAYVALNSFSVQDVVDEFDRVFDEIILSAKGLIIDVRENGGGSTNIGFAIIGRLINEPLKASIAKTHQYLPALRAFGQEAKRWYVLGKNQVEPRGENPYLGPVVVLTGACTVSAAEDFLIPLKASKRATLVGERTAGSTGMPLFVPVGGGVRARICTKRDTYPDGSDFVGTGVVPDVEVHLTQAGIAAGKDEILDKGVEILRSMME